MFSLTYVAATALTMALAPSSPSEKSTRSPYEGKTVLALDMQGIGLAAGDIASLSEQLAASLVGIDGITISTNVDLASLMAHAEQQELLGCTADRECLAKIAQLSQSDLLLVSSAGKVGMNYVLTLSLIDTAAATPLGKVSDTVADLASAAGTLKRLARELLKTTGDAKLFSLARGRETSLAVLDLIPSGVSPEVARNLTQVLSAAIKSVGGTSVISIDDVSAMVQVSETKAKLGCLDDTSCIAEIGGALGVQKLVVGTVGRLGPSHVVSLRLIDTKRVTVDNRFTEAFFGAEDQLIGATRFAARKLLGVEGEGKGQLVVTANETEASVFLNDQAAGVLPRPPLADLAPGQHRLRVEKPGYLLWQSDVYVEPNGTSAVWAELSEVPARWYQKWWVWTIVGTAIAGGATAAYFLTRDNAPETDLPIVELPR